MSSCSEWQTSENSIFVRCSNASVHGERSLQPGSVKYMCAHNHDFVEVDHTFTTVGDLDRIAQADLNLSVFCHVCSCRMPGKAFFKCRGVGEDGRRCSATSHTGGCGWLPQAVAAPEGTRCAVFLTDSQEDVAMFRFDPCGHYISLQALKASFKGAVESGQGRSSLQRSPKTGHFSFPCPAGCAHSFLHDAHHFKACDNQRWNDIMTAWGAERLMLQDGVVQEEPEVRAYEGGDEPDVSMHEEEGAGESGAGISVNGEMEIGTHKGEGDVEPGRSADDGTGQPAVASVEWQTSWQSLKSATWRQSLRSATWWQIEILRTLRQIQEALTEASSSECPSCQRRGQKNGKSTHIRCENCKHRYCYICSQRLPCGCPKFLPDIPELGTTDEHSAVQNFHVLKAMQMLHAIYAKDPELFQRTIDEHPSVLSDICAYDGWDANGDFNSDAVRPGITLTVEAVRHFKRPAWLAELPEST